MKKLISIIAICTFTVAVAQETPKKDCCAGKDKKECKMDGKKMAKTCDMKDHQDCKDKKNCKMTAESKEKKSAKKAA